MIPARVKYRSRSNVNQINIQKIKAEIDPLDLSKFNIVKTMLENPTIHQKRYNSTQKDEKSLIQRENRISSPVLGEDHTYFPNILKRHQNLANDSMHQISSIYKKSHSEKKFKTPLRQSRIFDDLSGIDENNEKQSQKSEKKDFQLEPIKKKNHIQIVSKTHRNSNHDQELNQILDKLDMDEVNISNNQPNGKLSLGQKQYQKLDILYKKCIKQSQYGKGKTHRKTISLQRYF